MCLRSVPLGVVASVLGPRSPLADECSPPSCTGPSHSSSGSHPPPRPLSLITLFFFLPCLLSSLPGSSATLVGQTICFVAPFNRHTLVCRGRPCLQSPSPGVRLQDIASSLATHYPASDSKAAMLDLAGADTADTPLSEGQRLPGSRTQSHPSAGRPGGSFLSSVSYVQPVTF